MLLAGLVTLAHRILLLLSGFLAKRAEWWAYVSAFAPAASSGPEEDGGNETAAWAEAVRLALERLPRLVMSDRLPMPFACGVLHPAIVLPVEAAEWDDRRRRTVLFHELAHLTRYDLVANALGQVAAAVYWFHPLVWTAVRKLRIESERACDDLVLGVGTRASEYADHLLQIVCRAARSRTPAVALPMAQRHEFEGRMLAILERVARREPASWRHGALLAALALALILPLAALAPSRPAITSAGPVNVPPAVVPQTDTPRERRLVDSRSTTATTGQTVTRTETVTSTLTVQGGDTAAVVAALTRALGDSVASVREDAAYALGQLEAGAAVEPLAARLLKDPVPKVREMCAWALAQIGNRGAVTTLSGAALKDSSAAVRGMAVWALGQLEDPGSVEPLSAVLRGLLRDDENTWTATVDYGDGAGPQPLAGVEVRVGSSESIPFEDGACWRSTLDFAAAVNWWLSMNSETSSSTQPFTSSVAMKSGSKPRHRWPR